MAKPVPMKQMVQADPREELQKRIQDAPIAHAEAVLSAYALLQQLHDTGTLDVLRGALGAGDVLVEHVVSLVTAPESITALRNVILIGKVRAASTRTFFMPCSKEFRRRRRRCRAPNRRRYSPWGGGSPRRTRAAAWQLLSALWKYWGGGWQRRALRE